MKIKAIIALSILALFVLSIFAHAAVFDENNKINKKIDSVLKQRIDSGEDIRVWVKTNEKTAGFAGKISKKELKDLLNNPGVAEIIEDPVLYPSTSDSIPLINADDVHDLSVNNNKLDGEGQNICVLDTGIDYNHPDLAGKIINGPDYANDDSDPMDTHGHGTHVAGIALAAAPGSKIVNVQVCNSQCYGSDISAGVQWCNNNKDEYNISVISISIQDYNSWIPDNCPTWMDSYLQSAYNNNIFSAVCSGNQGSTTGVGYPGCSPYTVSVGSSTKSDGVSSFSNRGPNLDLMAPGESIVSTCKGGGYCTKSGTSMSTPHVAGAAAL
ncbi:S8 family serine peptidase, partial [Candidatus Woesearchaeota archaeon]|nr:S8 family serine peptidase [Candidatus Woesearchaeota archaeon]